MSKHFLTTVDASNTCGFQVNRRSLLIAAGASAGCMLLPAGPAAARISERLDIRYVVIDCRHAASREFGRTLAAHGSLQLDVTDGLTRMWQETLAPLWRQPGSAIAGLTSSAVWTCLAEQARSQARRTAFKGRHVPEPQTGAMTHVIDAPLDALRMVKEIERKEHKWPHALAELISDYPPAAGVCNGEWRSSKAFPDLAMPNSLTSWIIA